MTRRQKIEQIVVGSLLCEWERHRHDAGIITPDMMEDSRNAEALSTMMRQHGRGQTPTLSTVAREMRGHEAHLAAAAIDGDFETNRAVYNMLQELNGTDNYTAVTFEQYITRFIELYEQERQ